MKIRILIISLVALFFSESVLAQQVWSTNQGDLKIYPIRHASMVWEWNGKTIYIDPVGDPVIYKQFNKPDLILITHSHGDHLSAITLAGINAVEAEFLVPQD
ncbi:MAG: MBL fold metallo-hydrolase, partial [Bacteroidales bacterium]|nr:MBL fold metallo-hydrolase [Bacteroidales bacterium]